MRKIFNIIMCIGSFLCWIAVIVPAGYVWMESVTNVAGTNFGMPDETIYGMEAFIKTIFIYGWCNFPNAIKGKDSMWQLLQGILECGLKNDALMEILYEQIADGYPVDYEFAVFVFHGVYDIPLKGKDKESLWESEEVYDFTICTVSPMLDKYEPAEPVFGFLYPAFSHRSGDKDKIDIFHRNSEKTEEGLMYKLLGKY